MTLYKKLNALIPFLFGLMYFTNASYAFTQANMPKLIKVQGAESEIPDWYVAHSRNSHFNVLIPRRTYIQTVVSGKGNVKDGINCIDVVGTKYKNAKYDVMCSQFKNKSAYHQSIEKFGEISHYDSKSIIIDEHSAIQFSHKNISLNEQAITTVVKYPKENVLCAMTVDSFSGELPLKRSQIFFNSFERTTGGKEIKS